MKSLGAKLSILVALIVSTVWLLEVFVGDSLGSRFQECGSLATFVLSFPIARLSGMFSHTDAGPQSELWW